MCNSQFRTRSTLQASFQNRRATKRQSSTATPRFNFNRSMVNSPPRLPPHVVQRKAKAPIRLTPMVNHRIHIQYRIHFTHHDHNPYRIRRRPIYNLFMRPCRRTTITNRRSQTTLSHQPNTTTILRTRASLASLPLLRLPPFMLSFSITQHQVHMSQHNMRPNHTRHNITMSNLSNRTIRIRRNLRNLSHNRIISRTHITTSPNRNSFIRNVTSRPINTPRHNIRMFIFTRRLVNSSRTMGHKPRIFRINRRQFPIIFTMNRNGATINLLRQRRPFNSNPRATTRRQIIPFRRRSITRIRRHVMHSTSQFSVITPLFSRFLLFPRMVLSRNHTIIKVTN